MGRMLLLALFLLIEALAVVATETAKNLNVAPHQNKVRKLGNHQHSKLISGPPCVSPSEPPLPAMDNVNYNYSEDVTIISSLNQEHATNLTQEQQQQQQQSAKNITIKKGKHHHSVDKSVAGGGVILGGLAATLLVAIACYIRATRRKKVEPTSPSSASSPTSSKV